MAAPEAAGDRAPTCSDPKAGEAPRWAVYVEDAVIILCILPLWPFILGWSGVAWEVLLYADAALLVAVLIRRMRRARAALEKLGEESSGRTASRLPFIPPGRKLE